MIPESYKKLIETLIEKNESGKSSWNETSVKNQYKLILNNGMIVLTCKTVLLPDSRIISLDIYDNAGMLVGSFSADALLSKSDYALLNELYKSILHFKEQKVDKQIYILMNEIRTSDKIGKED